MRVSRSRSRVYLARDSVHAGWARNVNVHETVHQRQQLQENNDYKKHPVGVAQIYQLSSGLDIHILVCEKLPLSKKTCF